MSRLYPCYCYGSWDTTVNTCCIVYRQSRPVIASYRIHYFSKCTTICIWLGLHIWENHFRKWLLLDWKYRLTNRNIESVNSIFQPACERSYYDICFDIRSSSNIHLYIQPLNPATLLCLSQARVISNVIWYALFNDLMLEVIVHFVEIGEIAV